MVEWHHRLNAQEFDQALGVGDGQGSLACYSPWGRKESPAQVEGTQGFLPQPEKDLERPSSTRLEATFPTMAREQ